jgi:putative Holliday junction resolvase
MNILSIDYGEKRIGLAWVDTGIGVVLPFGLALNKAELIKIIQEEKPDKLIIGLPLSLQNQETKHTEEIRKFADKLTSQIDVPIEFFDERFTSQQADAMGGSVSRDEKSAMAILEGYLEFLKNKK